MGVFKSRELGDPILTPHGETVVELLGKVRSTEPVRHSVALAEVPVGGSTINHYHPEVEESYYLLSGYGQMDLGEQSSPVGPGDLVHIPSGVSHKLTNTGEEPVQMMVVCVPPWDPDCSVFLEKWDGEKLVVDFPSP